MALSVFARETKCFVFFSNILIFDGEVRAHLNEDSRKFNLENKILFECDFAKKTGLRPMGNSELLVQIFMKSKKRSMRHYAWGEKNRREETRGKACVGACAPPPAYFCFRRPRLGSYRSQGILGGRRDP